MIPFFPRQRSEVLGIELHDNRAQFVHLNGRKDKPELMAYNRVAMQKGWIVNGEIKDEGAVVEALKDFFKNANPSFKPVKHVALLLPPRSTFAHIFTFPASFNFREIKKSIPFQAETVIPFSIQDVYWDIEVLGHIQGSKEQKVLFVAVPKTLADAYARLMSALNIKPFLFGFYSDVLCSAMKGLLKQGNELMIDFGSTSNNFIVLGNEYLVHLFSSNKGAEIITDKQWPDYAKHSLNQAQKIFKEYSKEENPTAIMITGEYAVKAMPHIAKHAAKVFPDVPVLIGDPKHVVTVEESRFKVRQEDFVDGHLYSVYFTHAIGIARRALSFDPVNSINLLPESLKRNLYDQRWSNWISLFLVIITGTQLFFAGGLLYLQQQLSYEQTALQVQKQNIERTLFGTRYQEIQDALTTFNDEVAVLSQIDAALFSVGDTLGEVIAHLPDGVDLTEISFNDESLLIQVEGLASTRESLLDFQKTLQLLDLVEDLSMPISNFDSKDNIPFTMEISLNFKALPAYASTETD